MNVLSAMAGINNGEFTKKFTNKNVDIITLGGYNSDIETLNAGIKNTQNNRKEFLNDLSSLNDDICNEVQRICNYNPKWKGLISVNLRGTNHESFKILENNKDIDILEVNAHCRQEAMIKCGAGQGLLYNLDNLSSILEEVCSHKNYDISVKIRANVKNTNIKSIVELIETYPVKYIHVDATNPGIMEADYDVINKISNMTDMHLIGNNSVTSHKDYIRMLESGADSVSVARGALNGNIDDIFK